MKRLVTLAALLSCLGCGRENLDLLETTSQPDPCLAFSDETGCQSNAALGCSFQPNDVGCRSDDASCGPGLCRSGDPFVRRVDRSFLLSGQPFRFVGVSSWALLLPDRCTQKEADQRDAWLTGAFDDLVASRTKVARMFAFQSSAGASGDDFSFFDAAVRQARRAGVRLVFMLEHSKGGCSEGGERKNDWYAGGFRQPDGSYALSYRSFAEQVATRYRKEPTVLGYVLVESMGDGDPEIIAGFVNEMGQLLHGVAPSQLLSLDLNWGATSANSGASYRRLQSLPVVDYVDVDDYQFEDSLMPMDEVQLGVLRDLDKPAVVAEGAFLLKGGEPADFVERGERVRTRLGEWRNWSFEGALLWAYQPGWGAVSEEFDARAMDPLLQPNGVLAGAPW